MKKFQIEINGEYFRSNTTRVKPGNKMNVDSTFETNNCGISTFAFVPVLAWI